MSEASADHGGTATAYSTASQDGAGESTTTATSDADGASSNSITLAGANDGGDATTTANDGVGVAYGTNGGNVVCSAHSDGGRPVGQFDFDGSGSACVAISVSRR